MASSTSSSDGFPTRKRWLRTWLVAALAAICFAVFVTRSQLTWFNDPTSFEKRIGTVQEHAIDQRPNARIIILGTSRAAFGLAPRTIESTLHRPARSVANWSYPGFGLATYEALVNANKDKIARAELLVLGIDPYFVLMSVDAAAPVEEPPLVTRNWAYEIDQAIRQRLALIAPVPERMAWFLRELGGQLKLVAPFRLRWTMQPAGNWNSLRGDRVLSKQNAGAESDVIVDSYYKGRALSPNEIARWKAFLPYLIAINPHVVLLDLPPAPTFTLAERPHAGLIAAHRKVFEELAQENGIKFVGVTATECGLSDDLFSDPVHTNDRGTERLSECLAQRLAREVPLSR